jgi:hypothetical protein
MRVAHLIALFALPLAACERKAEAPPATVQMGIDSAIADVRAAERAAAQPAQPVPAPAKA